MMMQNHKIIIFNFTWKFQHIERFVVKKSIWDRSTHNYRMTWNVETLKKLSFFSFFSFLLANALAISLHNLIQLFVLLHFSWHDSFFFSMCFLFLFWFSFGVLTRIRKQNRIAYIHVQSCKQKIHYYVAVAYYAVEIANSTISTIIIILFLRICTFSCLYWGCIANVCFHVFFHFSRAFIFFVFRSENTKIKIGKIWYISTWRKNSTIKSENKTE